MLFHFRCLELGVMSVFDCSALCAGRAAAAADTSLEALSNMQAPSLECVCTPSC